MPLLPEERAQLRERVRVLLVRALHRQHQRVHGLEDDRLRLEAPARPAVTAGGAAGAWARALAATAPSRSANETRRSMIPSWPTEWWPAAQELRRGPSAVPVRARRWPASTGGSPKSPEGIVQSLQPIDRDVQAPGPPPPL